ncbi:MAG: OmpA family protein [Dongiaceae bacterium]
MGKLHRVVTAAPYRSIRAGLTACGLAALLAAALPGGQAAAQSSSVTVDYGALDGAPSSAPMRPPASYGPAPSYYPTPLSSGAPGSAMPQPGWYYYAGPGGPGGMQGPFAQPSRGIPGKATATRSTAKKKKTATRKPASKPSQTAAAPAPQPAPQPEPAPQASDNAALTPPPEPTAITPPAPLEPVTPPPVAGASQTPPTVAAAPSASPTPEPAPAPAPSRHPLPPSRPGRRRAGPGRPGAPAPRNSRPAGRRAEQPAASAEPAPAPDGGTQAAAPTPPPAPAAADSGAAPAAPPAPAADQGGQSQDAAQTASLPPAAAPTGNEVRIEFPAESAEIPEAAKAVLDSLAQQLGSDESERIQLLAYAAGSDDNASRARRMSLSRALAVRSYLIAKGVRSTRMDVRALGNNVQGSPPDRVDIIPQKS